MKQRILPCLILIATFALLPSQVLLAQDTSSWTVEDIINQESVSSLEFSPNGQSVIWVKSRISSEKDMFVTDLYLTRLDMKEDGIHRTIQLTRSEESDYSPIFSIDGGTIYFLSSRKEGNTLWGMSVYGGEAYKVHTFDTGISDIQRFGEGKMAFKSDEGKTLHERRLKDKGDNTIVVEDSAHFKPSRIYSFDLEKKEITRLTDNTYPVGEYGISDDGRWLVSSHVMSPHYEADAHPRPTYYLWNVETGTKQEILSSGYQTPGRFAFTPDGKGFYFRSVQSSDPQWRGAGIWLLHFYDFASHSVKDVPIDWDAGIGWTWDDGFDLMGNDVVVGLANGPTNKLVYMRKSGSDWKKLPVHAGVMDEHITVTTTHQGSGNIFYTYSTASVPTQYRMAKLRTVSDKAHISKGVELITLNSHLDHKTISKSEVLRWTGALGDEITGILNYPHNYQPGRAYPLVVTIRGGPNAVDLDRWKGSFWSWTHFINLMAQKDTFILQPNYHGSLNHGQEFVESIKGHYYEYELPDIIAGVNRLVDEGKVDPDSLGVKGWSNGAILTAMFTVKHPDMFQAAASGAGAVNLTSDYGTSSFGVKWEQSYTGGAPWDNTDGQIYNTSYIQKSALFEIENVRTPTLIHHGSEDRNTPRDQAWEHYRALQQVGKAPVRFLWYSGEGHNLQKISHQKRKVREELQWFDRYLFGTNKPQNEAFKEDGPLAELLHKDKTQADVGRYGLLHKGVLIPETVSIKKDSTAIGRFEVTNAQYASYDQDHDFVAVRANYPVTDISQEEAQEYINWLNELTGETYRLVNAVESESLNDQARKIAASENTLSYWAGYDITIDEVPEFRQKLSELEHTLLKEAGSYKSVKVGDARIYDLGGNVAEIFNGSEAENTYGYSAVSFVDDRGEVPRAPTEYIGFRVIKEYSKY